MVGLGVKAECFGDLSLSVISLMSFILGDMGARSTLLAILDFIDFLDVVERSETLLLLS